MEVSGGREAVTAACLAAADSAFYAGHAWNPWFLAGVHTLAWELVEQTGDTPPAVIFAPVGQGGIILGLYRGFEALMRAGYIARLPRLVGVQAAACSPVVEGRLNGSDELPEVTVQPTAADGIRTPRPVRYKQILAALQMCQGDAVAVSEEDIAGAHTDLARQGLWVEPTSAVAAAGARRWLEREGDGVGGPAVVILTGHGFKAVS